MKAEIPRRSFVTGTLKTAAAASLALSAAEKASSTPAPRTISAAAYLLQSRSGRFVRRLMEVQSGYLAGASATKGLKLNDWLGGLDFNGLGKIQGKPTIFS